MRAGAAARLGFVPIVAEAATPEPAVAAVATVPAIEVRLAGAVLRVEPGVDRDTLTMVLRAIRASAA
jgi:transposase